MRTRPALLALTWFLLLAGLFLHTPHATAQEGPPQQRPDLTPDMGGRLSGAAQNPNLPPWQRQFMLQVARGTSTAPVAGQPPVTHRPAQPELGTAAIDGAWIEIGAPSSGMAIYDPLRDRMLVFGSFLDRNDVWALSLAGSPAWNRLAPVGAPPSPRYSHTLIYDPVRDRMLVFGGSADTRVWALSLADTPTWSTLSIVGTPPSPRFYHTAIYDPVRDRMVVFSGDVNSNGDVWALSLAGSPAWNQLVPVGVPPGTRFGHTAIYDPVRDRMLVFGGHVNGGPAANDVWALSLAGTPAWSALAPAGPLPSARAYHTAIYDPVRDRMLVFGGYADSSLLNDTWALTLAGSPAWSALDPLGTLPWPRAHAAAIYDPVRDRMLMFGGSGNNDTWALSLTDSPAWSPLIDAGYPPGGREGHTAIYDPVRDRMLVFGGVWYEDPYTPHYLNDVWALSLTGSATWSPWSELAPVGTPPSPRAWHTATYDPVRDRMLVFGGVDEGVGDSEVWALSLGDISTWSVLTPAGIPPPPRVAHTAIYDPVRDRILVFGGGEGFNRFNDVWALSLAGSPAWSALAPVGEPPTPRLGHAAIYDPVRDRMVVFGGYAGSSLLNDTWALTLAGSPAWSALAPAGTPPSTRYGQTAIYDPVRDRMVVFGGYGSGYFNDAWALSLAGSPAWNSLVPTGGPPARRQWHTAIFDPLRDRMLVFGGLAWPQWNVYVDAFDTWALEWATPVSVPEDNAPAERLALVAPRPNPAFGQVTVDFTVPQAGQVSLVIYDVTGRMVRELAAGPLAAGRHSAPWNGRDRNGRAVPEGIYFAKLAAPGVQLTSKLVIVHAGSRE